MVGTIFVLSLCLTQDCLYHTKGSFYWCLVPWFLYLVFWSFGPKGSLQVWYIQYLEAYRGAPREHMLVASIFAFSLCLTAACAAEKSLYVHLEPGVL